MPKANRGGQRAVRVIAINQNSIDINGENCEYEGKLIQTGNDPMLGATRRPTIEAWEAKRADQKVEYANAVGHTGQEYGEVRGRKGSVKTPIYYHTNPGTVFTHIHPRDKGILGGTFSTGDIQNFINGNNDTVRAVAKEGTYSISRTASIDPKLSQDYKTFVNGEEKKIRAQIRQIQNDYNSLKITYKQAVEEANKANNTKLVSFHNWLYNNQKKYGYKYYLEKRS